MEKTDSQLNTQALQIKQETITNANTAQRVGVMLEDMNHSKFNRNTNNPYSIITADNTGKLTTGWRIYDESGLLAADYSDRLLTDVDEIATLNWGGRVMYDPMGEKSINWASREAGDAMGGMSIQWDSRGLVTAAGQTSIDWQSGILYEAGVGSSLSWYDRALYDNLGYTTLDWQNYTLGDTVTFTPSVDWGQRLLYEPVNTNVVLSWETQRMSDADGVKSISWSVRNQFDTLGEQSIDWGTRRLINTHGVSIKWTDETGPEFLGESPIFTNNNATNVSPNSISGSHVNNRYIGGNTYLMTTPNRFLKILAGGVNYYIPMYTR